MTARYFFLGSKSTFGLEITSVCNYDTSHVTRKSTDLSFKLKKKCALIPFQDGLIICKEIYSQYIY